MRVSLAVVLTVAAAVVVSRAAQTPSISIHARAVQPGEVVAVTVNGLASNAVAHVRGFGRTVALHAEADSHHGLIGIDLDTRVGNHVLTVDLVQPSVAPVAAVTTTVTVRAKAFPTRRLTVEPRFVEPPANELQRIDREARRLAALWESSTERRWSGPFTAPVTDPATSAFGSRSIFNGQARSPHGGADFSSPTGRPVVAPGAGLVVLVDDLYYTGQTVVVDHGLGLVSLFAHLSSTAVTPGQRVERGDTLGQVGATGRVTGPHLHWTVRLAGARVDPLSLIAATGPRK